MLEIGDKVITVTNDDCNGTTGVIREIWEDGYSVYLDDRRECEIGYWFAFGEVEKVDA